MDILKKSKTKSVFFKSISLIVSIVMILSVFAVSIIASADDKEIWDGSKSSTFSGGEGTEEKPYLIENGAQLAYVVSTNLDDGLYFKLVKDIYLNDTSKANWKDSARNWVWGDIRFVGTFDGDGHTIDGLYFNGNQKRFGLFSFIGDSLIKKVRFTNAYINNTTSEEGQAIVAAQASAKADFDQIYIDETCSINAPNAKGVAGIIGRSNQNINITNSAVLGTFSGKSHVGSFYGTHWGGNQTIKYCFSASNVPIMPSRTFSSCENAYATVMEGWFDRSVTLLTADQMKGEAAKTNMSGLDFENVFAVVENNYPIFIWMVVEEDENPEEPEIIEYWDGTKAAGLSEFKGSGTEADPYQIENGKQLAYVVSTNLDDGLYFKLTKNIYLNDTSKADWKDSARNWVWGDIRFVGTFDGDGHTIDGLYFNGNQKRFGLFSFIGDSLIKKVRFTNAYINNTTSEEGQAIVAAQASAKADFDQIYIDETCSINAPNVKGVAGIIGRSNQNVNITNSIVLGTYTGGSHVGAFFGTFWGGTQTIKNSFTASNAPVTPSRTPATVENTYAIVAEGYYDRAVTILTADQMKGEAAKTNMAGLDFENVFKTVANNYPVFVWMKVEGGTENPEEPENQEGIWDGTKAAGLSEFKGNGTEETPYEIENGKQLAYVVSTNLDDGLYFKLVKDIYLNDTSKTNWEDTARNWVWGNIRFVGNFDGQGHTIDGLYYNGSQNKFGLFSYVGDSLIKNFKLTNAYIDSKATEGVAFVAGQTSAATSFEAIYIDETCEISAPNAKGVAGIVGFGYNNGNKAGAKIKDSAVLAKISGKSLVGAFTGTYWAADSFVSINNSFTSASLPLSADKELSDSVNNYGTVADNYGTNVLTADQMKGQAAKTNMSALDFDYVWKAVDTGYPVLDLRERPSKPPRPDFVWDGTKADAFAGGSGTPTDPYLIENGAQLYKMVCDFSVSSNDGVIEAPTYFKIVNDIYLNDVKDEDMVSPTVSSWNDAGHISWATDIYKSRTVGFCGEVDGGGHTVYGLYYTEGNYAGLIPIAADTTNVYNLSLKNSFIRASGNATAAGPGGIIGLVSGAAINRSTANVSYCKVDNCYIVADHKDTYRVGAVIGGGYNEGKVVVSNCAVTNIRMDIANPTTVGRTSAFLGSTTYTIHEVTNCFTDSSIHPVTNAATKENYDILHERKTFTNVYTSSAKPEHDVYGDIVYLTEDQLKGEQAKSNLIGFDFENDWAVVANDYPAIRENAGVWIYDTALSGEVWSGKVARFYSAGVGSKEKPYEIATGGQLALLANDALNGKTAGKYYKITEDIILNDTSKEDWKKNAKEWYVGSWEQAFAGHLDGGYHTISGLYLNKTKDNYAGPKYYGGLFAAITVNAVIEKLGIVNSSLTFTYTTGSGTFVGAFAGFVSYEKFKNATYENYPLIRECFADTSVYLHGNTTGGFIGSAQAPTRVEDSFFTGVAKDASRGLFGYSKMSGYEDVLIKNFYAADSKYAILSNVSYDTFKYENCYSSAAQDTDGVTRLFIDRMIGTAAKTYMKGFDFEKVWAVRGDKETPGLKGFKADAFNNVMNPEDIVVNFEANCDMSVEAITGKAYSKITLPVLKREGYTFEGWYAYPELDVPYTFDYFPTFNTILYAKWSLNGIEQTFELYEDTEYDYHEDYEFYKPTMANYSTDYVRNGGKSIHRIGDSAEEQDFLVNYANELEVGRKYKMVFYTTTDKKNASVDVSLVHLDWPDVYSANNGVEKIEKITNLKNGEWIETTFTFVARSKWVAIRTSGNSSVFFDDIVLYDVGKGTITNLKTPSQNNSVNSDISYNDDIEIAPGDEVEEILPEEEQFIEPKADNMVVSAKKKANNSMLIWYIIIAAASAICLGVVVFVIVRLVRKKR